jgi:hypothetical protein
VLITAALTSREKPKSSAVIITARTGFPHRGLLFSAIGTMYKFSGAAINKTETDDADDANDGHLTYLVPHLSPLTRSPAGIS